ncbi:MAG: hypothetical protein K2L34_04275 [Muribaculaceae bacterium]|nr:hypothetical protein [Muribaculaceae bacterium]
MKKFHIFATAVAMMMSMTSCDLFELDNYDEPKETIQGDVAVYYTHQTLPTNSLV